MRASLTFLTTVLTTSLLLFPPRAVAIGDPQLTSADAAWYSDGSVSVRLFQSSDTLNVVLQPQFAEELPPLVLHNLIDRHGRHCLVRFDPGKVNTGFDDYAALPEVEAVQPVYYTWAEARIVHERAGRLTANGRIAISLPLETEPDALLADFGLRFERWLDYLPNTLIATVADTMLAVPTAQALSDSGRVRFAAPQFGHSGELRALPNDPLFPNQWHLRNTGQLFGLVGADLNILTAWEGVKGHGTIITIIDDGLDWLHQDMTANVGIFFCRDINDGDDDPSPDCYDGHGTAVAGVAAALQNNRLGVSGVAPRAALGGVRLLGGPFSDEDTADALLNRVDAVSVYNNSWGPKDDGRTIAGPGPLAAAALRYGVEHGRNGLGAIYVWAGGNGGTGDDANFDGFVNSPYTIGVAASTNTGLAAPYTELGACLLVNAPSSGGTLAITSTDTSGPCGAGPGEYTSEMVGTSAAAPMVAGVAALMLNANPSLTWRDVQHILVRTAVKNDPGSPDWRTNAAGLHVHPRHAFGRVDAAAAVAMAAQWGTVLTQGLPAIAYAVTPPMSPTAIPDDNPNGIRLFADVADRFDVEHVQVTVHIAHARRGDLEIVLTAPSGTASVLATSRPPDFRPNLNWTFMTVRNWNEPAQGTWTLTIRDRAMGALGTITSWSLRVNGRHIDIPPGDMNGDGVLNTFDIDDFFLGVSDREAYRQAHPGMDPVYLGDFDENGQLDYFDLPGFAESMFR